MACAEPLPLPDFHPLTLLFFGYLLLAPIVAGIAVGKIAKVDSAAKSAAAVTLLLIPTLGFAIQLMPHTAAVAMTLAQVLLWIPLGAFAAWASENHARARRRFTEQSLYNE